MQNKPVEFMLDDNFKSDADFIGQMFIAAEANKTFINRKINSSIIIEIEKVALQLRGSFYSLIAAKLVDNNDAIEQMEKTIKAIISEAQNFVKYVKDNIPSLEKTETTIN